MIKNVASQTISAQLISKADGTNITGNTTTVYVTGDNGTQATTGTATHKGNGLWTYTPSQAETNYDYIDYTFVNTTAVTATRSVYTRRLQQDGVKEIKTSQAVGTASLTLANGTKAKVGDVLHIFSATTGADQSMEILSIDSSVPTAKVATMTDDWPVALSPAGVDYICFLNPPASTAAPSPSNIEQVNNKQIQGSGTVADPFRPV